MSASELLFDLTFAVPLRPLERDELEQAFSLLLDPAVDSMQKEKFLAEWAERGELPSELAEATELLLPRARDPEVRENWQGRPLFDCCGTGGGGLNLFNVSTALLFILPELGIPVVKHGNRGVTKKSGSADVLEALGLSLECAPGGIARHLEEVGAAFLFAPAYQPSFAVLAPIRRKLAARGIRTIFNLLGPLLNPARPQARLLGVFQEDHLDLYSAVLRQMNCPRFAIAYGIDAASGRPLGEVSASGATLLRSTLLASSGQELTRLETQPTNAKIDDLLVATAEASAGRLLALLAGEDRGSARALVLANAALSAWVYGAASSYDEGLARSAEALDSGGALRRLRRWQALAPLIK